MQKRRKQQKTDLKKYFKTEGTDYHEKRYG